MCCSAWSKTPFARYIRPRAGIGLQFTQVLSWHSRCYSENTRTELQLGDSLQLLGINDTVLQTYPAQLVVRCDEIGMCGYSFRWKWPFWVFNALAVVCRPELFQGEIVIQTKIKKVLCKHKGTLLASYVRILQSQDLTNTCCSSMGILKYSNSISKPPSVNSKSLDGTISIWRRSTCHGYNLRLILND